MANATLYTRDGLIYVVTDGLGHFKVGISDCKVFPDRLAGLQTGNPFRLRSVHTRTFPWEMRFLVEEAAHDSLSAFRVRGEWFRSSQERIVNAVNVAVERILSTSDSEVDEAMNALYLEYSVMRKKIVEAKRSFTVPDSEIVEVIASDMRRRNRYKGMNRISPAK